MKSMKKYYLALAVLIPIYIAIEFVASMSDFFSIFNALLIVVWAASLFAFLKQEKRGNSSEKPRKLSGKNKRFL